MGEGKITTRPFVAFDLTRLFIGPIHSTPRGIDRIEVGLAKYFFSEWHGDSIGTLPTPLGVRCLCRKTALRVVEDVSDHWGENVDPDNDTCLHKVKCRITDSLASDPGATPRRRNTWDVVRQIPHMLYRMGRDAGRLASAALPPSALYVNTGQIGIAIPQFLIWLRRRPDVKPVFMLHDTIPIDHAEFVPPSAPSFHRSMIASTARYASGVIVTTQAAQSAVSCELQKSGRAGIAVLAEHLPVSPIFRGRQEDADLAAIPYFVVIGSIEPRKNHLLLLNVWKELVRRGPSPAPKLVIAGTRWGRCSEVTDTLDRSTLLKPHVIEVRGLSTPGLRRLLSNACGLLMPSFAEGFGLPIIEALALGTPVIASDLPAHREAGGEAATYLSPIDGLGWLSEIRAHVNNRAHYRARIASCRIRTWPEYLRKLDAFLEEIHAGSRAYRQTATSSYGPHPAPPRTRISAIYN